MRGTSDPEFGPVFDQWLWMMYPYIQAPEPGRAWMIRDWVAVQDQQVFYYGQDQYSLETLESRQAYLRLHWPDIDCTIASALRLTTTLDQDITHAIEIPGVWLVLITNRQSNPVFYK